HLHQRHGSLVRCGPHLDLTGVTRSVATLKTLSKPNMVCGPTKISEIGIGIRFGFFNNADHSVRVCILYPREKKHCGKWYAEDSNGEHV
ncbi:hypothetical protein ACIQCQ_40475, partial [Streptomyces sp. NPDC088394]|uniref:hypothetical protein n=1 Tax=Streptomyces sp. NPDC088394 TaxID=3365860 RepID=UPI003800BA83